jgi:hypothetical protein
MPLRQLSILSVSLFLFLFLFLSCSPKKAPTGKVEDYNIVLKTIIRTDSGLFRGVNLGMEPGNVKVKEENKRPQDDEVNYLSYAFAFSDSLTGNYYYDFDEGLDEIGVDIYREKAKDCDWLFTDLKNYYTRRYGQPKTENNMLLWYIPNQGKEGAEVSLQDESKDYGYGKLTITIFPFQSEVDPKDKEVQP